MENCRPRKGNAMEHMPHKGTGFMPPKSEQYMFSYIGAVKKEASENKCSDLQKRERCICFCDMIKLQ